MRAWFFGDCYFTLSFRLFYFFPAVEGSFPSRLIPAALLARSPIPPLLTRGRKKRRDRLSLQNSNLRREMMEDHTFPRGKSLDREKGNIKK